MDFNANPASADLDIPTLERFYAARPQSGSGELRPNGKAALERRDWLVRCAEFAAFWGTRTSDMIPREHPLEDWITRQRRLAKDGRLVAWKRAALDAISFPYDAAKTKRRKTDLDYAKELIDYYRAHGHYSPAAVKGSAGLARWTALMRQTNGRQGLETGTEAEAAQALAALRDAIPGFSLLRTSTARRAHTATVEVDSWAPPIKQKPSLMHKQGNYSDRLNEIHTRAEAAMMYGLDASRLGFVRLASGASHLGRFLQRAQVVDQAVRVRLGAELVQQFWLHSLMEVRGRSTPVMRLEARSADARRLQGAIPQEVARAVVIATCEGVGYSADGKFFEARCATPSGDSVVLDIDAHLYDLTHAKAKLWSFESGCFKLGERPAARVRWDKWLYGRAGARVLRDQDQVNVPFEDWFGPLCNYLDAQSKRNGPAERHVSYSGHYDLYKFIEHLRLKGRVRGVPVTHMERVCDLDFTWGRARTPIAQVICALGTESIGST